MLKFLTLFTAIVDDGQGLSAWVRFQVKSFQLEKFFILK